MAPQCTYGSGPPCHPLLDDALAVLEDPDRWPDHLYCDDVARESTARWAERKARLFYGNGELPEPVQAWVSTWPLPVFLSVEGVPDGLLPFGRTLGTPPTATFILEYKFIHIHVTAFGLWNGFGDYPTTMQFTMVGWKDERAERFITLADKWWSLKNATGRPHGPSISREDAITSFRAFRRRMHRDPEQHELAAEMDTTARTLRTHLGPWKAFQRAVQREQGRGRAYREALRRRQESGR